MYQLCVIVVRVVSLSQLKQKTRVLCTDGKRFAAKKKNK